MAFHMRRPVSVLVVASMAVAVLAVSASCGRKTADEPAAATPSLTLSREKVPLGSPVKLTYKFVVAPNGPDFSKLGGDYWVFVHVLDPTGEQLWTEDHLPATPTSAWKPGQTIEYTRTVFVPNYPYIGEAAVRMGLYLPASGKRLVLNAPEASRREYVVTKFQLLPQSENVFLIYKDGWHAAEVANDPLSEWQWTKKAATISFRNPKKDTTFYLDWDARADLFNPPQQVTLRSGNQTIATFPADNKLRKLLTFPITAAQLGTGDMAEIVIEVDRTFSPGGTDTRELGIRVFHAFVEPK
jgi:hypothetical protein